MSLLGLPGGATMLPMPAPRPMGSPSMTPYSGGMANASMTPYSGGMANAGGPQIAVDYGYQLPNGQGGLGFPPPQNRPTGFFGNLGAITRTALAGMPPHIQQQLAQMGDRMRHPGMTRVAMPPMPQVPFMPAVNMQSQYVPQAPQLSAMPGWERAAAGGQGLPGLLGGKPLSQSDIYRQVMSGAAGRLGMLR